MEDKKMEELLETIGRLEREIALLKKTVMGQNPKESLGSSYDEFTTWLFSKLDELEYEKAYTSTELFRVLNPDERILSVISNFRSGNPLVPFGRMLSARVGIVVNGCVLKKGSNEGCTTYRKVKL